MILPCHIKFLFLWGSFFCRDEICGVCSLLASEICWELMSHSTDVANTYFDGYISSAVEKTCSGYTSLFLFIVFAVPFPIINC